VGRHGERFFSPWAVILIGKKNHGKKTTHRGYQLEDPSPSVHLLYSNPSKPRPHSLLGSACPATRNETVISPNPFLDLRSNQTDDIYFWLNFSYKVNNYLKGHFRGSAKKEYSLRSCLEYPP